MPRFIICLSRFFLLLPGTLWAKRPNKGFHTGPYLLMNGGFMQYDWDVNQRTLVQEGDKIEPIIGFTFGWHLLDWLGTELQTRYSTSDNNNRREHVANINMGLSYTFLGWEKLLDLKRWRILPFVKGSFCLNASSLPGDIQANDERVSIFGIGPGVGGGIHIKYKYLYFGMEAQEDFIHYPSKSQEIFIGGTSAGTQEIYRGGVQKQFSVLGVFGVHY